MGDNNILHGSVTEAAGGDVLIKSGVGTLKMSGAPVTPSVGDKVTVAVRANSVRVAAGSANATANQAACTLAATEYLGDTIKVHMRAGEHALMAKLPEQRYPELASLKDKPVLASWDATDVQLLRD
jgi:TOBE domain-containing protein